MALCPSRRAHPDGGLQCCCCPWRQQEEERTAAQTSRTLELRSLQRQLLGARTRAASVRTSSAATLGHALFILGPATAPLNAARSRNSWSMSARGANRPLRMTPLRRGGPAWRRPPTPMLLRRKRSWGTKPQRRTLRASSTSPTPSPGVTSAARSCTSCTTAARSSSPEETSRPSAGKFSR
jgi:hypothetical protein